jgi:hypothetical protein
MAMKSAKSLRNTLAIFFKENGRDPDFNEFRKLVSGDNEKKEKPKTDEEKAS